VFDIHQSIREVGVFSDDLVHKYSRGLFDAFENSPEGTACAEHLGGVGWALTLLELAFNYIGCRPQEMSVNDLKKVLFQLIPQKVSIQPEAAPAIVAELRAFWEFLGREYGLPNAPKLLAQLNRNSELRLARELSNPHNFDMAKSFFMAGSKLGFDMTSEEGLDEFIAFYNGQQVLNRIAAPQAEDYRDITPAPAFSPTEPVLLPVVPAPTPEVRKQRDRERKKKLEALKRRQR
jgi:hypothetical protein